MNQAQATVKAPTIADQMILAAVTIVEIVVAIVEAVTIAAATRAIAVIRADTK